MYIYFKFRKLIKIPSAKEQIDSIRPGVMQVTKEKNTIDFWFYSLSRQSYIKYTLDNNLNIQSDSSIRAPVSVLKNGLPNEYYFNFAKQQWESIEYISNRPTINEKGVVEHVYNLCTGKEDCVQKRNRTYIKFQFSGTTLFWNEQRRKLQKYKRNVFPIDNGIRVCKFTINRYKSYLGLSVSLLDDDDDDDIEQDNMSVYFEKNSNDKWILKTCEPSSIMFFNGHSCKQRTKYLGNDIGGRQVDEIVRHGQLHESELVDDIDKHHSMFIYLLKLSNIHSIYVDLNNDSKTYLADITVYKSCHQSLYIIGKLKSAQYSPIDDGDSYEWEMQQIIDYDRIDESGGVYKYCPLLEKPKKVIRLDLKSELSYDNLFLVYRNKIHFLNDKFTALLNLVLLEKKFSVIQDTQFNIDTEDNKLVMINSSVTKCYNLLPHIRKYELLNLHSDTCVLYCQVMGETIFDIYTETRLLFDFIENLHLSSFFNRRNFRTIQDDFQFNTWSCNIKVQQPETYSYISLCDLYNLDEYAKQVYVY